MPMSGQIRKVNDHGNLPPSSIPLTLRMRSTIWTAGRVGCRQGNGKTGREKKVQKEVRLVEADVNDRRRNLATYFLNCDLSF